MVDNVYFVFVLIVINGCFRERWITVWDSDICWNVFNAIEITSKESARKRHSPAKGDRKKKNQRIIKKNRRRTSNRKRNRQREQTIETITVQEPGIQNQASDL